MQIQEELGDRLQLSHKLVKVSRHGGLWASTFETPLGSKVTFKSITIQDVRSSLDLC